MTTEGLELAKSELEVAIEVAENNAPISEAEGELAQALLQRTRAEQCRRAIDLIDRELAQMEGEMMDKSSPYWRSDKRQADYRRLVDKRNTLMGESP